MFNDKEKRCIFIGSDHAGFEGKEILKDHLGDAYAVTDLGCFSEDPCDYPDISREVSEKVIEHGGDCVGVILCGSGTGVCMAANRFTKVRAANCVNEDMAEGARQHNNANILCLGARMVEPEMLKKILDKFLNTDFPGEERHVRRVEKLKAMGG